MRDEGTGTDGTAPLTRGSVIVAGRRGRATYLVLNQLIQDFDVSHVVFERWSSWRLLKRRAQKLGVPKVCGQLAFLFWDRSVTARNSIRTIRALTVAHASAPPDDRVSVTDLDSINDSAFTQLLAEVQPAVVVVAGTGIISKRVLEAGPTFINIHCGITPRYRGVHGAFWAIVEGRPDLAGTTVHVIDPGIDTGPVIAQALIEVDPVSDTFRTLPVKQYLAGLPLLTKAVSDALEGRLETFTPDAAESRLWSSPTVVDHLRFRRQMRRLRRAAAVGGRPQGSDEGQQ